MTTQSSLDAASEDLVKGIAVLIGVAAVSAALVAAYAIYAGAILWIMWGWFMVPLGVPAITVAWAIGLSTLVIMLIRPIGAQSKEKTKGWASIWIRPLFLLGVAYVAKLFM